MMQAWADYLDGLKAGAEVILFRRQLNWLLIVGKCVQLVKATNHTLTVPTLPNVRGDIASILREHPYIFLHKLLVIRKLPLIQSW
jgi:hypothetical protein